MVPVERPHGNIPVLAGGDEEGVQDARVLHIVDVSHAEQRNVECN